MPSLDWMIILDLSTLILCSAILLQTRAWVFLHPATFYFIFHLFVVTLRLVSVRFGATLLFDVHSYISAGFEPIRIEELIRAGVMADVALFTTTLGFVLATDLHQRRLRYQPHATEQKTPHLIRPNLYLPSLRITFVIGLLGLVIISYLPGFETRIIDDINLGGWENSSWIFLIQTWAGLALIGFIYYYGFKRILLILLSLYLFLQFYQGFHRFRIVLPLIAVMGIYVKQHGLQWPRRWMIISSLIFMLLFLPAKTIGRLMQRNASLAEITTTTTQFLIELPTRAASDLTFLDQFGIGLSLIDNHGSFYYGRGWLPLITLPIPRPLWEDKPNLAFYMFEIATPTRPVDRLGMILTYLGEAYLNFGLVGVIFLPFLLAYVLGRFFHRVAKHPNNSLSLLIYIIVTSSLVQVYRDGISSLVLFTLVTNLPLFIIIGLHYFIAILSKNPDSSV